MAFEKKIWLNVPDPSNPPEPPEGQDSLAVFDADNMNRIEDGIESAHNKIDEMPDVVPIEKGGTGATTAEEALKNLGGISISDFAKYFKFYYSSGSGYLFGYTDDKGFIDRNCSCEAGTSVSLGTLYTFTPLVKGSLHFYHSLEITKGSCTFRYIWYKNGEEFISNTVSLSKGGSIPYLGLTLLNFDAGDVLELKATCTTTTSAAEVYIEGIRLYGEVLIDENEFLDVIK